jgi:excisionase family DNA binding protein
MSEKLMTPQAIAEITGFHARTVSEMGKRGEIPGAVLIGKHIRFKARSVHDFLERGGDLQNRFDHAEPTDSIMPPHNAAAVSGLVLGRDGNQTGQR